MWALSSCGVCCLSIAAFTCGMVMQVGAWTYNYSKEDFEWNTARQYCQEFFTDLVAIQNKEEIEYLNRTLPYHSKYYWLGIRKRRGVWTWVGTEKVLTEEEANWATGEPNNRRSNQDCVEIYIKRQTEAGKWNDEPCTKKKKALCYKVSCQPLLCGLHGDCVEVIQSYKCECHPGFEGDNCENAVQCPILKPGGAYMNCSHPFGDFRYNSTCTFWCPEGFERRGVHELQCLDERQWSAEIPTCIAVTCPVLSATEHGELNCSHVHGNFTFGSKCDHSCQPGFELMGQQRSECTASGTWTEDAPQCKAVTCPVLSAPEHGELNCSHLHGNFTFGSTCGFSCQPGFELMGPQHHECLANGIWNGDTPQCKAVTCPVLSAPEHGELNCSHVHGNFTFGTTCGFSCQPGFELMGPQHHECLANGTWNGDSPQCKAVTCPVLSAPAHGELNCSHLHGNFTFGTTCGFSCQPGFELMGSQSHECLATGNWTEEIPQCKAVTCPVLSAPEHGELNCSHVHGNFTFGSKCDHSCQPGFELMGLQRSECTASGTWTEDTPQCKAVTCPVLSAPEHGELNCSHLHGNFTFGSTCYFSCQPGFELMGPQHHECTAKGIWNGDAPRCKAITCPVLSAPEHGELNCSHLHGNFTFGTTCGFSCQPGFELMGTQSHKCLATGNWTEDIPQCKAVTCPVLSAPEHGELNCSHVHGNFTFGSTCYFSCQRGFEIMGPQHHECTAKGIWNGDTPQCKAVTCQMLSAPEHGELNCSHLHGNFTFGTTCYFSCQPGFELMGSHSRDCMATGTWAGDASQCQAISCPVLDAPNHGHLYCSHPYGNFTFNSTCTFSCKEGFMQMGAEVLRCAATGNWTRQPPLCEEDSSAFLKQVLVYTSTSALAAAGLVLSGTLIALLAKQLSDREEKKKLLNPTSDLGAPGIFTNAAYDSTL
ncbi:P-selectin-like [Excalfactoria chinensis]|uniref:P-selectin-like n=1 Tax=Excalfactoria chinensis TaxID=46218 RepID=UPI003B3BDF6B